MPVPCTRCDELDHAGWFDLAGWFELIARLDLIPSDLVRDRTWSRP